MSSTNRFAPLAERSSSKEKESSVPTTDITDQTMRDASQAGSSSETQPLSMSNLKESLPTTHAGRVEYVRKRRAEFEAEQERKKLQQSNASKGVTRPLPSAASSQLPCKRTASSDEAEEPPRKRRRLEPVPPSPTPGQLATSASAAPAKWSPSVQDIVPYIDPNLVSWWANIRTPEMPLPCIIQVNYLARMGSFDKSTKEWAFHLTLDAGFQRSPAMTLKFFSNGVRRPQNGETGYLLSDVHEDEWMILKFQIFCLADYSKDRRIHHQKIFNACRTEEEMARLVCIRLTAWPKVIGRFDSQAEKHFPDVFTGRRPYHLHIWFIAPYDVKTFEEQCLKYYTHYFEHRQSIHSSIPPL